MGIACLLLLTAFLAYAQPARVSDEFQTTAGVVKITPIHHASVMVQGGGQVIQIDPVDESQYADLPKANLILITHDHRDHMDAKAVAVVRTAKTPVIGPEAVARQIEGVTVLRNGDSREFGAWKVEAVPAYNLSKPYHPKGQGNGYVLTYGGKRFYFSGDTEGTPEMRALKNIDVAYVCMNLPYTMTPEEAADAVRAFKPRVAIPYHYRGSDPAAFAKALAGSGIEVRIRDFYR
jgi:L-ascorbate metabolism protein UlaG (beta-lactamase superfamily)